MAQEIPYSAVKHQIEKLREQGLIISNEKYAEAQLICYGYSNLIKSYREPYVIKTDDGKKKYRFFLAAMILRQTVEFSE